MVDRVLDTHGPVDLNGWRAPSVRAGVGSLRGGSLDLVVFRPSVEDVSDE